MTSVAPKHYTRDDAERVAQYMSEVLGYDPVSVEPLTARWAIVAHMKGAESVRVTIWRDGEVIGNRRFASRSVIEALRKAEVI